MYWWGITELWYLLPFVWASESAPARFHRKGFGPDWVQVQAYSDRLFPLFHPYSHLMEPWMDRKCRHSSTLDTSWFAWSMRRTFSVLYLVILLEETWKWWRWCMNYVRWTNNSEKLLRKSRGHNNDEQKVFLICNTLCQCARNLPLFERLFSQMQGPFSHDLDTTDPAHSSPFSSLSTPRHSLFAAVN